jgi:hypothetical protein
MWMCDRCQEINETELGVCPMCGHPQKELLEQSAREAELNQTAAEESAPIGLRQRLIAGANSMIVDAREWTQGRMLAPRAILLIVLAVQGYFHLIDPGAGDIFSGLTLGVHEMGHVLTRWAPFTIYIAAGSIAQVLGPIYLAYGFLRQRDYFALSVAGFWLSFSLFGLAQYIGDARAMVLQLVTVGPGDPIHDWHYLLGQWGILPLDTTISQFVTAIAIGILFASLAWGGWICYWMVKGQLAARWKSVRA